QTVVLDVTGQTPTVSATYNIDGGDKTTVNDAPYSYTIDPATLAPGDHTLNVDVVNQAGVTTSVNQPFTVAALPPVITITGLTDGQEVKESTDVKVTAAGQTPVTSLTVSLNGKEIANATTGETTATLDPAALQPGKAEFKVVASTDNGQSATQTLN